MTEDYDEQYDNEQYDDDLQESIVKRLDLFTEPDTQFKPLSEAVTGFLEFARHPELRVWTGIQPIDDAIRGIAPGELCQVNGFAHNGKTVLVVEMLLKNEGRVGILFTPDETRTAVLIKLAASVTGIGAEEIERRVNQEDPTILEVLDDIAQRFSNLAVFDDNISLHSMDRAYDAVRKQLGPVEFVVFDYADLLDETMEPQQKLRALKGWGKDKMVPFILLHQSSKSAGGGGKVVSIESGSHDRGDTGTFIIGVRRKINMLKDQIRVCEEKIENTQNEKMADRLRDRIVEIETDLIPRHQNTITVSLVKNKRPPMRKVDEIDFRLDTETGRLIPMGKKFDDDELPDMPLPVTFTHGKSARQLLAERGSG